MVAAAVLLTIGVAIVIDLFMDIFVMVRKYSILLDEPPRCLKECFESVQDASKRVQELLSGFQKLQAALKTTPWTLRRQ